MTVDWLEKDAGDLYIPEFALGFLVAMSHKIFLEVSDDDDWEQVNDVPLQAGRNCEYKSYDLNFWYSECDNKWYCTAYAVNHDEDGRATTDIREYRRLW